MANSIQKSRANRNILIAVIVILIVGTIAYLVVLSVKLKARVDNLEKDRLLSIRQKISSSKSLPEEVKEQLLKLVNDYRYINKNVSDEILSLLNMAEVGEKEQALATLAKVIECLLKEKYQSDSGFRSWFKEKTSKKKNIDFADVIEYAHHSKLITKQEAHFANGLREIRNKKFHEVGIKLESNWIISGFLAGISLVLKVGYQNQTSH
ncbi:MAG: hypothetical protein FD123_3199 [Bacteroidetes bacterium]|nr:MAG: hypothetical protein FD123_3199 [Bacteroidota bacterium]